MGQSITVCFDNNVQIDATQETGEFGPLALSPTFGACLQKPSEYLTEIEQIGGIANQNLMPLMDMTQYPSENVLAGIRANVPDTALRNRMFALLEAARESIDGNIDRVLKLLGDLIYRLDLEPDLPSQIQVCDADTLNNAVYFAHFANPAAATADCFGRDIRNLETLLRLGKARGANSAYFGFD